MERRNLRRNGEHRTPNAEHRINSRTEVRAPGCEWNPPPYVGDYGAGVDSHAGAPRLLKKVFIEPGEFLFHDAFQMHQLCRAVFLSGEKDESHVRFAALLQGAVIHPTLLHGHAVVVFTKHDEGWSRHFAELVKGR